MKKILSVFILAVFTVTLLLGMSPLQAVQAREEAVPPFSQEESIDLAFGITQPDQDKSENQKVIDKAIKGYGLEFSIYLGYAMGAAIVIILAAAVIGMIGWARKMLKKARK
ncbi:MAG: hypothetical protein HGA49_02715 [Eubacteriaceae bacterium]|nr:hypothetical protein [Eubacteriaceae bacterium]